MYAVGRDSLEGQRSTMALPLPWFEERVGYRSTAGYAGDGVSDAFLRCHGGSEPGTMIANVRVAGGLIVAIQPLKLLRS